MFLTEIQVERCDAYGRTGGEPAAAARQFERWADDPHPRDCLNPSELYVRAGTMWGLADDDRAVASFRRAVDLGYSVEPDARCYLVQGLLDAGRATEADSVAAELRDHSDLDPYAYELLGHAYQDAGRLHDAHGWFTVGVRHAERIDHESLLTLLTGRAYVRRLMRLPADKLDQAIIAVSTAILRAATTDDAGS